MSSKLFYWRGSGDVRVDVLAAIKAEGYQLEVITLFEDVLELSRRELPAILVVDASAGESEASVRVVELSAAPQLRDVPIVFVSYQAEKRSSVVKRQFSRFIAIDIPFQLSALVAKLRDAAPVISEPEISFFGAEVQESEKSSEDPRAPHNVSMASPKALADPHDIREGVGGTAYAEAGTFGAFDDEALLPHLPYREVLGRALNEMTNANGWLGLHARRVSFVSSAVLHQLGLSAEDDKRLRAAALLLNWGLRDAGLLIPVVDLFHPENRIFIGRIAEGFRSSAQFMRENLDDQAGSELIMDVVAHLSPQGNMAPRQGGAGDMLLAMELTDRACWGTGQWDPYGAHRAVRKLASGDPVQLKAQHSKALARLLAETSASRHSKGQELSPIPPSSESIRVIQASRLEGERLFARKPQKSLQVFELQAGMRIVRPVLSWDGQLVVAANVVLDEDMLLHLLQLATIRPLQAPIMVLEKSGTARVSMEQASLSV